jgi:phage I-like protein
MRVLITAALANALGSGLPEEIVYLPEGDHQIKPWVDGKPQEVTVKVPASRGAEIAASLQSALDDRMKSNVRPWFDFEHKRGVASALPKAFRYEPGKGVMAAIEWTGAGKAAIEGKDFSYFSPVFLLGDDGVPDGLPERGPLGGLVNEPAFREIPRIAASDAAGTTDIEQPPAMSKLIFAALAISAAAENAETEAVKAIDRLKVEASDAKAEADRLKAENSALTKKVEASDAAAATARKERANTLVQAAVADGRIAVKDTEKQDKFRSKIEAGDTFAEEILAQLPKQHDGLDKPIVSASGDKSGATSIDEKAKALVTAGDAKDLDEARGIIFASDSAAYSAYLASLKQ